MICVVRKWDCSLPSLDGMVVRFYYLGGLRCMVSLTCGAFSTMAPKGDLKIACYVLGFTFICQSMSFTHFKTLAYANNRQHILFGTPKIRKMTCGLMGFTLNDNSFSGNQARPLCAYCLCVWQTYPTMRVFHSAMFLIAVCCMYVVAVYCPT